MPRMSYSRRIVGSKRCDISAPVLEVLPQDLPQPLPQFGMGEAKRDGGFEKAELVAAIIAATGKTQTVKGLTLFDQPFERVGQLDFAAAAPLAAAEMRENLGLDDIAADDCRGRRRRRRIGFFDDAAGAVGCRCDSHPPPLDVHARSASQPKLAYLLLPAHVSGHIATKLMISSL